MVECHLLSLLGLGNGCTYSVKIKLREILMALLFPEDMEAKKLRNVRHLHMYVCSSFNCTYIHIKSVCIDFLLK